MSSQMTYLLWSAALAFVYMLAQATAYRLQTGVNAANSTRDDEPEPNLLTGRATRALRNFQETYPIFLTLSIVAIFSGRIDGVVFWERRCGSGHGSPTCRPISWGSALTGRGSGHCRRSASC